MNIEKYESLCDICRKKIKYGTECLVNEGGGYCKQLKLCRKCSQDLRAWKDTINDYVDELEEDK